MRVSTHGKSQIIAIVDQLTGLGMKTGLASAVSGLVFLLVIVWGGHISVATKVGAHEKAYLEQGVALATRMLVIGALVAVISLVIRFPREAILGQALLLAGVSLYFGVPLAFGWTIEPSAVSGNATFTSIVRAIRSAGGILLLPGLTLVLRDAILRIWIGLSVRRVLARRQAEKDEQLRKRRLPKLLAHCWDMEFCRDFVRKVCPAWEARKSCWRIKRGCYCEERTILLAMTAEGRNNEYGQGFIKALGLDKPAKSQLSQKLKRERCRRCAIYAEHQRQKYQVLSPVVFPAILLPLYAFYGPISSRVATVLEKADRFLSFMTYRQAGDLYAFDTSAPTLTVLAIVWLTIIAISYALRILEYLVFELKV
ncbi:MAG: hypothetical protein N3B12_00065 [Armatimonadetes bacterium]|nr:hypothetical protein [Armatimonadota bacterium]